MCEVTSGSAAPTICNCHHKMPVPVLKLKVGKTYVAKNGSLYKIVSDEFKAHSPFETLFIYIGLCTKGGWQNYNSSGECSTKTSPVTLVSEYKEPEYWYIAIYNDGSVNCSNSETDLRKLISKLAKAIIRINKETYVVEQLPLR